MMVYYILALLALSVLVRIRMNLVDKIRTKELDIICNEAKHLRSTDRDWLSVYREFDAGPSHNEMLLDLTKWTHEQFYPHRAMPND